MILSLKHPDSDRIMPAIKKVIPDFCNCPDFCGLDLGEVCYQASRYNGEEFLKDIALVAYGSDLPSIVDRIRFMTFIGDGDCPDCGSDEVKEGYEWGSFACLHCGNVWVPVEL